MLMIICDMTSDSEMLMVSEVEIVYFRIPCFIEKI